MKNYQRGKVRGLKVVSLLLVFLTLSAVASPSGAAGISLPDHGATVSFSGRDTILIDAWINGRGPYTVIFDTGANTIISESLAREIGVKTSAGQKLLAFAGSVDANEAVIARFQIGALKLTNLPVHVVPFPYSLAHISRRPIVAAIGLDLLPLLSIRIDTAAHRISFYPPDEFMPPNAVEPLALERKGDVFSVEGKLDGEPSRFDLDTGQDVSLTLYSQAVKDRDLIQRFHAVSGGSTGQGFGGRTRGWFARAPSLELGGVTMHGLVAKLSTDSEGLGAGAGTGNLGMGFFKRFTVTFDGPRSRIYLEPNARLERLEPFNRAGLQMEEQQDGAHVTAVLPGSPAADAGIKLGDVITSAGGQSFSYEETFDGMFLQPPGTPLALKVRGRKRAVRITLKDAL